MNAKEQAVSDLIIQVRTFYSSLRVYLRARLKEHNIDLTTEMLQVLRILFEKNGINQQEIANITGKDKTSITYLIDNLTKRNLVNRIEDDSDRRNKLIFLTKEGKKLKNIINKWYQEMFVLAASEIPATEIKKLTILFNKINLNLNPEN